MSPWRNPEFIRHFRAELRWSRAVAVAAVVIVVCSMLALVCWSYQQDMLAVARRGAQEFGGRFSERLKTLEQENATLTFRFFFQWLLMFQTGVLTLWSLISCAQAVSGEREAKTWDFQRITRLSPAEMLVGKLLGEPILAYFAVGCSLPLAMIAGIAGGFATQRIASAYIFMLANSLFLGLVGLCLSTLVETRSRGLGLVGALGLYFLIISSFFLNQSGLPGLSVLSPLTAIRAVADQTDFSDVGRYQTFLFGNAVPWLLLSLLLQFCLAVWIVVILLRNLKRAYEQIQPLSRMQAVGCAAFLNVVVYALIRPHSYGSFRSSQDLASFMVMINGLFLLLVGMAILAPAERLRVWRRMQKSTAASLFSESGLPWPWLVLGAAVIYIVMICGLLMWARVLPVDADTVCTAGLRLLVVLVFVVRDVSFIQWCNLTRLRQPVVKGLLYLCLYYGSALVLVYVTRYVSPSLPAQVATVLTPIGVFDSGDKSLETSLYAGLGFQVTGMVVQFGLVVALMQAISRRLSQAPAVSS